MALIDLVKVIPDTIKSNVLLKNEVALMLRYSFLQSENEILENKYIDLAIVEFYGSELIFKKELRSTLLLYSENKIKSLGYSSVESYEKLFKKDKSLFFNDFEIEDHFRIEENIEDDRTASENVTPNHGEFKKVNGFPHFYQKELKDRVYYYLFKNKGVSCIANMPTGGGKTSLAMELLVDFIRNKQFLTEKNTIVWIVDSSELAEQSFKSFVTAWQQKGDIVVEAFRFFSHFNSIKINLDKVNVVFTTFSLVTSRINSYEVKDFLEDTYLMVIDECHASNANTYKQVIQAYTMNYDYRVLGLTATPYRTDDNDIVTLKKLFNTTFSLKTDNEEQSPIDFLQEHEYLAKIDFKNLEIGGRERNRFKYYKKLHNKIISICKEVVNNKENIIIFAESKQHAISLSIYLNSLEVANGLIVGETPNSLRNDYIERFSKKNDLYILINYNILSTGIDVPGLNSIMVLSEIESPTLALQVLGRAMRGPKNGGNQRNTIYLTTYNYEYLRKYNLLENKVLGN
ncbi:hypothetical protein HMPREF9714_01441 [Myroides odoratimimus CCUG 12901]|uniref:DEAD/DEAH box helicase n=1 Tax=Myroides odoratimimus TaxID=76832 RepID=UPI0002460953|nr:DEAD/DEAH box helicase family protein [Myroides odoratimimus]EHO11012.1 hypothetical protein HMPREF9714_01441 [Myroides odoratimimus CCUG 12901]MDM1412418.1 DEAD/DEAH box helicase family protein [Myroides odoratimimus]